jgi:hypothetical protein
MATEATTDIRDEKTSSEHSHRGGEESLREQRGEQTVAGLRPSQAARYLGYFSIGLGAAQLLAPRGVASLVGVRGTSGTCALLRALGAREVLSGIGILRARRPRGWLWARVAGDAMDLALLGSAMRARRVDRTRLGAATAAVAGVAIVDALAARRLEPRGRHLEPPA